MVVSPWPWVHGRPPWPKALAGSGGLWLALAGPGWLWLALGGSGWLWLALAALGHLTARDIPDGPDQTLSQGVFEAAKAPTLPYFIIEVSKKGPGSSLVLCALVISKSAPVNGPSRPRLLCPPSWAQTSDVGPET